MYVIFPLDDLLDLNSAKGSKRETASSSQQSYKRHTVEVLSPSQPNQQLPCQLQPPLNQLLPNPQKPTPPQQQQQQKQQQQQQQQQQQLKIQKTTSQKTPSKASSSSQTSPLSPQLPSSVPNSSSSSSYSSSLRHPPPKQQRPHHQPEIVVEQRQPSSYSASTETSSVSSTGAKTKVLLSPPSAGGKTIANRSSWSGCPTGPPRESSVTRSSSFRTRDELTVDSGSGVYVGNSHKFNSLRTKDLRSSDNHQDPRGSGNIRTQPSGSECFRSHIVKSESFRSYLSGGGTHRPQQLPVADTVKSRQLPVAAESVKPQQAPVAESVKPQQLPFTESVKHHQEYLPQDKRRPPVQRHPSSRSSHSSGSQKAADLSPYGGPGPSSFSSATAGARAAGANLKIQGGLAGSRGLQKGVMASEISFRDLTHPSGNETLKAHNSVTFKLVKTAPAPSS
ncbi:uncharacterized protein [Panulirus ornatus]|uniref:uncharacterized protein isoform X2 n=1 Tax=Panulirus ornatus TaxID=150431 RepID=UPI003A89FE7E